MMNPIAVEIGKNAAREWLATSQQISVLWTWWDIGEIDSWDLWGPEYDQLATPAQGLYSRLFNFGLVDLATIAEFWTSVLGKAEPDADELYGFAYGVKQAVDLQANKPELAAA
jgi:hypothetical protein